GPDRSPAVAEAFLVGVAVLRNDGGYPLGMTGGESEAGRRAVVKDIHGKAIEADDFAKALDHASDLVERVIELISGRHVGLTEPGKVRRDHMKSVGEERDKITEHVSRAREAVQQQKLQRAGRSGFAIENLETIDVDRGISDGRHEILRYLIISAAGYGANGIADNVHDDRRSG